MNYEQQRPYRHHAAGRVLDETPVQGDVFDDVRLALLQVFTDIQLRPFNNVLDRFRLSPGPLIAALKKRPLGSDAVGPAKELWDALVEAIGTTSEQSRGEPWRLIRAFAAELVHHDREATRSLLVGLIAHGAQIAAPPAILSSLKDDLNDLKVVVGRRRRGARMRTWSIIFLLLGATLALTVLIGFERYNWNPISITQLLGSTAESLPVLDEIRPEVGKGQYFSLASIRYCRFQEERIRLIKSAVRGSEDVDAFNAIVRDFNSRCSDFYFRDSDVATVTTELAAHHERLSAEALQIVATWPKHAVAASEKPAP
jgi:hypothetical protein